MKNSERAAKNCVVYRKSRPLINDGNLIVSKVGVIATCKYNI